jgi:3-hydroxyisobutyrate dehydrogenase-like beta-hydroxyacid dehydrogenase
MTKTTPVAVLGLGNMGRALANAFLAHGHPTTVWNRSAHKAEALVAAGATLADSPAAAVAAADLVVVCVVDYPAVHAILDQAADALRGRTLVNLTADSPASAREMAAWAAADGRGVDYLDGSIMTPTVTINTPDAVLIYSGPSDLYERHRSTLAALGGTQHYLGTDPGRAAAYDVALLDMFWTAVSGMAHGFALAKAEGISGAELAPFATGIAGLLSGSITDHAERLDTDRHEADIATLDTVAAGLAHVIHAARQRGLDATVQEAAHAQMRKAIDAGHGDEDLSRLTTMLLNTE